MEEEAKKEVKNLKDEDRKIPLSKNMKREREKQQYYLGLTCCEGQRGEIFFFLGQKKGRDWLGLVHMQIQSFFSLGH